MNLKKNNEPPHLALAFLHWFCHPRFVEELEGDLRERFQRRSEQCSVMRNRMLFIKEVITLFRPSLMGNFHQLTFNSFSSLKRMAGRLPEYYLFLFVFLYGYTQPFFKPVVLWVLAVLMLQIILKNKIIWTLIAGLFLAINFYMILALISEFSEFPTFVAGARNLIFGGSAILIFNIAIGGALIVRYMQLSSKVVFRILYFITSGWYALALMAWSNSFPAHETSGMLFNSGSVLFIITLFAGIIVIYRGYKKVVAKQELQADHSVVQPD